MKRILSLIVLTSLFFVSCSSDDERGPQGPPGEDGASILGQTFEVTVDFTDPNYSVFVEIPQSVEILNSDVILVYLLESVDEQTGENVWSPLPQTFYLDGGGEIQYNYNHTLSDVNIFLNGSVEPSILNEAFTDNQTFRMVVVPSDFALNSGVDINDFQTLKTYLNINETDIKKAKILDK